MAGSQAQRGLMDELSVKKTERKKAMEADLGPVDVGKQNNSKTLFQLELKPSALPTHKQRVPSGSKTQRCSSDTPTLYQALCWVVGL